MDKKEKAKQYYESNKEAIKAKSKARRANKKASMTVEELAIHKEKERIKNAIHYQKNRDRILGYKRKYREINKERLNESVRSKRAKADVKPHDYLKRNYGITYDDYVQMLKAQNGVCAICGKAEEKKRLAVDHCHNTGKIRGLLCGMCNTAIGKLNDDVQLLRKAIQYLEKAWLQARHKEV
jgi:hypothetical protein